MKKSESVAERIKRLREHKGWSQRQLADACGWGSQSRIGNYEAGTRGVNVDDAAVIAKALGVTAPELLFGEENVTPYKPGRKYPVLSSVQAGAWAEAVEAYTLSDVSEWLESDAKVQGDSFWLKVEGESMTAPNGLSVPEGSYVLFDTGRDPVNGSLVIAKLVDDNEATFKKLIIDTGKKYLKALNPAWPPMIPINGNCKIIGVGVETKMRLI